MQVAKYLFWGMISCSVANAEPAVDRTEVNTFRAVLPANGKVAEGSCWTGSIAVDRPGAWRCRVGNEIHDPCFTTAASKNELVCDVDPASGKPGFRLKLTQPLPETETNPASARPWILQLAKGAVCKPYTGTMPVTDKGGISYYCTGAREPSDAPGDCDTGLLSGSVREGRVWTATRVTFCSAPTGKTGSMAQKVEPVSIRTVWR